EILYDISKTPIVRHIKVKGQASPDDPTLREYWHSRSIKNGKNHWAKGSKYEQIAKFQEWKCPICGDSLFNGEEIETHHIVPVKDGGSDDTENLIHLHKACHKQVHSKPKLMAGSKA
ncbi:HNH endonuclease, partial [Planktothricoides raciborskii]